jgi:hypothetical protein
VFEERRQVALSAMHYGGDDADNANDSDHHDQGVGHVSDDLSVNR